MDGFCLANLGSFPPFASVEKVQAIFIRRLGCLNVEQWVDNFKRV